MCLIFCFGHFEHDLFPWPFIRSLTAWRQFLVDLSEVQPCCLQWLWSWPAGVWLGVGMENRSRLLVKYQRGFIETGSSQSGPQTGGADELTRIIYFHQQRLSRRPAVRSVKWQWSSFTDASNMTLFFCFQKSDSEGWNMAVAAVAVAAILVLVVPRFTRAWGLTGSDLTACCGNLLACSHPSMMSPWCNSAQTSEWRKDWLLFLEVSGSFSSGLCRSTSMIHFYSTASIRATCWMCELTELLQKNIMMLKWWDAFENVIN